MARKTQKAGAARKRINLALQGGGAHGAFTWGVLEALLDCEEVEIAAISATSAGAMNGAALKSGLIAGGREGARENLEWLWSRLGALTDEGLANWLSALSPPSAAISGALSLSAPFVLSEATARMLGPYDSPFAENPLAPIAEAFRYDHVCAKTGPDFFVCATNVRTGKIKVFEGEEITPAALLASACLPTLFRAVEIEDSRTGRTEAYWDGGYSGNPALYPLFRAHLPADVVIVNINPLYREELPRTARDIADRVNEISFNSSLLRELRAIAFVTRLIGRGAIPRGEMREVLVHKIADDGLMTQLSVATKIFPNPVILQRLREAGRAAATAFLEAHLEDLNERSSVDMEGLYG